jgi:hypothetical protein
LKCLALGVMVALLYVWPLEFLVNIFTGGPRWLFNGVLGASALLAGAIAWILALREMRYWEENWHTVNDHWHSVSDFTAPSPWG